MLSLASGGIGLAVAGINKMAQGMAAFGASVVEEGAAYTKEMSNVAALTNATGAEFDELSAKAEHLGSVTKFTSTEAAEGMSFLAMAGFEVNEIVGAMPGVLNLASAANMDLGRAADVTSNILTGMNLEVEDTDHLVNVLAKTASSANTNVEQLGQAMKFVAPVAGALGMSVEDTSAALAAMGDSALQSGVAGRNLRGIISKLSGPTGAAKDAMESLGVEIFNTDGTMKRLPQIVGDFNNALTGMTDKQRQAALGTIFSREELAPFLILMNKGQDELEDFSDELANSSDDFDGMGTAAGIAAKQLDNLSGDTTLFQSALSGVKIGIFKALEPLLRSVVQAGTGLITKFGKPLTDIINNSVIPSIQYRS